MPVVKTRGGLLDFGRSPHENRSLRVDLSSPAADR
jgi:hypothetical protein